MATVKLNQSVDKIIKVLCLLCKNQNRHKVLTSVDTTGEKNIDDSYSIFWSEDYQVIECQGCGSVSFRSEFSNSEDRDEDGYILSEQLYPKRTASTWNIKDFFNIPYNLRRIYRETIDCFNNESLTLCGAGIRALVEGLCNENAIVDGEIEIEKKDGSKAIKRQTNLQGRINGLYEKGFLTRENTEILHEHRFLGNTAIHDLAAPTKEELSLALEIVEHVFDNLYEIPQKAMQLKRKRLKKQK